MARIRTIKPDFFKHEALFDAEKETGLPLRLAFAGLWTQCDRAGRFQWRPRALKTDIMPYDEIDFSRVLDALATRGFVVKYTCNGEHFGCVPSWHKHQVINNREMVSVIPDPPEFTNQPDASGTRQARDTENAKGNMEGEWEGKGKDGGLTPSCEPDEDDVSRELITTAKRLWNDAASSYRLPPITLLREPRRKALKLRLGELGGIDGWRAMIEIIGKSPHLLGENERGWKASFDWILKPANLTKVMEGNYVRAQTDRPSTIAARFDAIRASLESGSEQGDPYSAEDTFGLSRLRQGTG